MVTAHPLDEAYAAFRSLSLDFRNDLEENSKELIHLLDSTAKNNILYDTTTIQSLFKCD